MAPDGPTGGPIDHWKMMDSAGSKITVLNAKLDSQQRTCQRPTRRHVKTPWPALVDGIHAAFMCKSVRLYTFSFLFAVQSLSIVTPRYDAANYKYNSTVEKKIPITQLQGSYYLHTFNTSCHSNLPFLRQKKQQMFQKSDLNGIPCLSDNVESYVPLCRSFLPPLYFKSVYKDAAFSSGRQLSVVEAETKWPGRASNADKLPPFIHLESLLF